MDRRTWKEPVDERIVADGIFLQYRAVLRITDGAGLLVAAHAGTLWITEEGDRRDIVVTNGRSQRIESDRLVIVNALVPTSVTISAPLGIPARWTDRRQGPGGEASRIRIRPRSAAGRTAVTSGPSCCGATAPGRASRAGSGNPHATPSCARTSRTSPRSSMRAPAGTSASSSITAPRLPSAPSSIAGATTYSWPARESRFI
jgi:hypothetical protein